MFKYYVCYDSSLAEQHNLSGNIFQETIDLWLRLKPPLCTFLDPCIHLSQKLNLRLRFTGDRTVEEPVGEAGVRPPEDHGGQKIPDAWFQDTL